MGHDAQQLRLAETVANAQANGDALTENAHVETEVSHEHTLFSEPIAHIGDFTVTNSLLTSWIAVLIIVSLSLAIRLKLKQVPSGIQNFFEAIIEQALKLCDQVTNERRISEKIFPVVFTIFLFVLINNWLGIVPGVGSMGFIEQHDGQAVFVPLLRGGTADINSTLALAIFSVIGSNIFGVAMIGFWNTLNKYLNIKALFSIFTKIRREPTIILTAPITFAVGLIEVVGEFAKVASLSFRLFGNVFAGEVLLASMAALFSFVLPIPFLFLEVAVGVIQALIFAMLTLVYFTIAAQHHDDHESEGEAVAAH